MAQPQELPQLVGEFVDMAKTYVRQETIGPAKNLGRYFAFLFGASFVAAIMAVPAVVAGTRYLVWAMPEESTHQMWTGAGYMLASLAVLALAGIVIWAVNR